MSANEWEETARADEATWEVPEDDGWGDPVDASTNESGAENPADPWGDTEWGTSEEIEPAVSETPSQPMEPTPAAWDNPATLPNVAPVYNEPAAAEEPGWLNTNLESARGAVPAGFTEDFRAEAPIPEFANGILPVDMGDVEPKSRKKGVILIIIVALVLLLGAGVAAGILMLNKSNADTPTTPPTISTPSALETVSSNSVDQFSDFDSKLGEALTNHDADAYYSLFTEQSQKDNQKSVAETAIKALPAGATYKVTTESADVAGQTAAVKLKLEQTYRGETTSSTMQADLIKENGEWKLVVKPANTQ